MKPETFNTVLRAGAFLLGAGMAIFETLFDHLDRPSVDTMAVAIIGFAFAGQAEKIAYRILSRKDEPK